MPLRICAFSAIKKRRIRVSPTTYHTRVGVPHLKALDREHNPAMAVPYSLPSPSFLLTFGVLDRATPIAWRIPVEDAPKTPEEQGQERINIKPPRVLNA